MSNGFVQRECVKCAFIFPGGLHDPCPNCEVTPPKPIDTAQAVEANRLSHPGGEEPEITHGSDNVFADLGFPDAEELQRQAREMYAKPEAAPAHEESSYFDQNYTKDERGFYVRNEMPKSEGAAPAEAIQERDVFIHEPDCPCYEEQHSQDCANCECQCTRPPKGWRCTREVGHAGPCAAVPVEPESPQAEGDLERECDECGLPFHTHPSRLCDVFIEPSRSESQPSSLAGTFESWWDANAHGWKTNSIATHLSRAAWKAALEGQQSQPSGKVFDDWRSRKEAKHEELVQKIIQYESKQSQPVIEPQLDVEAIARYIESDSECLMEIVVGETKKQYGVRLLKTLANEIREQFRKAQKESGK